jgi:succinate dehydrogenase/fumarate reductase flavoprotein subunit
VGTREEVDAEAEVVYVMGGVEANVEVVGATVAPGLLAAIV